MVLLEPQNMNDIASRVKARREKLGLTGRALTELLRERGVSVSYSWLRNVETGAHTAGPALRLLELSRILGTSLEWLLTGRGRR